MTFVVSGPNGAFARTVTTNVYGAASLTSVDLPAGQYTLKASFSGEIDLGNGSTLSLTDRNYQPSSASIPFTIGGSANACTPGATTISVTFNKTPLAAGSTVWFNSAVKITGVKKQKVTVTFNGGEITSPNAKMTDLAAPNATITFDPDVDTATTIYDAATNTWRTVVPIKFQDNIFLSGLAFTVPTGGLPGSIGPVTWQGSFYTTSPDVKVEWQWGAAVYKSFSADLNALGVKPVDGKKSNPYNNQDSAGAPENYKAQVTAGATGNGGSNYTGDASKKDKPCK